MTTDPQNRRAQVREKFPEEWVRPSSAEALGHTVEDIWATNTKAPNDEDQLTT
jgi:hypothetical protein